MDVMHSNSVYIYIYIYIYICSCRAERDTCVSCPFYTILCNCVLLHNNIILHYYAMYSMLFNEQFSRFYHRCNKRLLTFIIFRRKSRLQTFIICPTFVKNNKRELKNLHVLKDVKFAESDKD